MFCQVKELNLAKATVFNSKSGMLDLYSQVLSDLM